MDKPQMKVAQLDQARLEKVHALEKELGVWVVALEPEVQLADLSMEQMKKVQVKEKELGVVLLAYKTG